MTEPQTDARWVAPSSLEAAAGWSWRLLVIAVTVGVALAMLSALSIVVIPMILALFLAAALSLPNRFLLDRGWRPAAAAITCLLALLVALGLVTWLVVEALLEPWPSISAQLSDGLDIVERKMGDLAGAQGSETAVSIRRNGAKALSLLLGGALTLAAVATSLLTSIMLSLFVTFFYLKDGPVLWAAVARQGGGRAADADRVGRVMWEKIRGFVRGTAGVAVIDALGIGLGAWALGVPSPAAIFALTFLLAFIPYFGAFGAGLVACVLAVASGGLGLGLAMLVVILVVQQIEGNVLQPLLMGSAVDLHPLVVALGVIAGGAIGGVLGMFVAVPVIASVTAAVRELRVTPGFGVDDAAPS